MASDASCGRLSASLLLLLFVETAIAGSLGCLALDGDTLVCDRRKIRLVNVYAAEMEEAGGAAAKRRLQALLRAGQIQLRTCGEDRYGRVLAEVFVNGRRIEQSDIGPRAGRGSRNEIRGTARRASGGLRGQARPDYGACRGE